MYTFSPDWRTCIFQNKNIFFTNFYKVQGLIFSKVFLLELFKRKKWISKWGDLAFLNSSTHPLSFTQMEFLLYRVHSKILQQISFLERKPLSHRCSRFLSHPRGVFLCNLWMEVFNIDVSKLLDREQEFSIKFSVYSFWVTSS